jgi:hypothetical protein
MSKSESLAGNVTPWHPVMPSIYWDVEGGFHIVGDRHADDGTREHLVLGSVPEDTYINNARIVGIDDLACLVCWGTLSHLSSFKILSSNAIGHLTT